MGPSTTTRSRPHRLVIAADRKLANSATPPQAAPCGAERAPLDSESFSVPEDSQTANAQFLGTLSALLERSVVMKQPDAGTELQALIKDQQGVTLSASLIDQPCFA